MAEQKVLLVDDDKDFVEVTRVLLESNGYKVVTAHSGKGARKKAIAEKPDLIILDVMMETDTAGFDAARWLRSQEMTAKTPVIMLTGVNQKYPFQFGPDDIWLPVDEFFEKPVAPEKLLEVVKRKTTA